MALQIDKLVYENQYIIVKYNELECSNQESSINKILFHVSDFRETRYNTSFYFQLVYTNENKRYKLVQDFKRIPHYFFKEIIFYNTCCNKHYIEYKNNQNTIACE